jgi:integrase
MTNPSKAYSDRSILTNEEIDAMLAKADKIKDAYFRLRVKAIIALAKKFGKRRSEISTLKREDLKVESEILQITFTIRKKHKKGLFQYIKILEKQIKKGKLRQNFLLDKSYAVLLKDWRAWQQTKEGHRIKEERRAKGVSVQDKYAKLILEYMEFLKANHDETPWLFPSGKTVFGESYIIYPEKHLSGRHMLSLIKPLNPSAWMHLFRETRGAEVARDKGRSLDSVFAVRDSLDLENEATAYRYVRRYAVEVVKTEV